MLSSGNHHNCTHAMFQRRHKYTHHNQITTLARANEVLSTAISSNVASGAERPECMSARVVFSRSGFPQRRVVALVVQDMQVFMSTLTTHLSVTTPYSEPYSKHVEHSE